MFDFYGNAVILLSMTERAPAIELREGAFCEWPPNPPIGQLKLRHLRPARNLGSSKRTHLYALIRRRFGLEKKDIFKKDAPLRAPIWDEDLILQVFALTLDGKYADEIAIMLGMKDVDQPMSNYNVWIQKTKRLSALALHVLYGAVVLNLNDTQCADRFADSINKPEGKFSAADISALKHRLLSQEAKVALRRRRGLRPYLRRKSSLASPNTELSLKAKTA